VNNRIRTILRKHHSWEDWANRCIEYHIMHILQFDSTKLIIMVVIIETIHWCVLWLSASLALN